MGALDDYLRETGIDAAVPTDPEEVIGLIRSHLRVKGTPTRVYGMLNAQEVLSPEDDLVIQTEIVENLEERICALEALELGHGR